MRFYIRMIAEIMMTRVEKQKPNFYGFERNMILCCFFNLNNEGAPNWNAVGNDGVFIKCYQKKGKDLTQAIKDVLIL